MANFTDSEVTTIQNALVATRQALEPDKSPPQVQEIIKMIIESERILSGKSKSSRWYKCFFCKTERYFNTKQTPVQERTSPDGCCATVIQKTKALMNMFHPTEYNEPEPIGASIASKIVAGHKVPEDKGPV